MPGVLRRLLKPMTKAQFAAAEAEAERLEEEEKAKAAEDAAARALNPRKRIRKSYEERPVFGLEDFRTFYATDKEIQEWIDKFPALKKRNFYLVQNHHATAFHFDLRLQLDGKTVSFAIPKGLSFFRNEDGTIRKSSITQPGQVKQFLAVETSPHPLNYTLFEGGGIGTTAVWDIGSYQMHETASSLKRRAAQKEEETTDEEGSEDERMSDDLPFDYRQEDLFYEGLCRGSFIKKESRWGQPGQPAQKLKPGEKVDGRRGFTIELNGRRYQGLKLRFSRKMNDYKESRPRGIPKDMVVYERKNNWFMQLADGFNSQEVEDKSEAIFEKSILTGRTMDGIKEMREVEKHMRDFNSEQEIPDLEGMGEGGSQDWKSLGFKMSGASGFVGIST